MSKEISASERLWHEGVALAKFSIHSETTDWSFQISVIL